MLPNLETLLFLTSFIETNLRWMKNTRLKHTAGILAADAWFVCFLLLFSYLSLHCYGGSTQPWLFFPWVGGTHEAELSNKDKYSLIFGLIGNNEHSHDICYVWWKVALTRTNTEHAFMEVPMFFLFFTTSRHDKLHYFYNILLRS